MLLIGLLIQKMGRTQNPVKMYHNTVPSLDSTPDSEGLLMIRPGGKEREREGGRDSWS